MQSVLKALVVLSLLLSSCSRGDRKTAWLPLHNDSHASYFYTLEKMSRDDQRHLVKVWVKTVFNQAQRQGDEDVLYTKNLFMIRCDRKTYRMNVGFYYSPANEIVSRTDEDQDREATFTLGALSREHPPAGDSGSRETYLPIPAGSPAERLYGIVCR